MLNNKRKCVIHEITLFGLELSSLSSIHRINKSYLETKSNNNNDKKSLLREISMIDKMTFIVSVSQNS